MTLYSSFFLLLVCGLFVLNTAFLTSLKTSCPSCTSRMQIRMGGAAGLKTTRAGKQQTVEELKILLEKCTMIFGVNVAGFTPNQLRTLRQSLPEGTKFMVTKNRLLKKAAEGSQWTALDSALKNENGYFFIADDLQGSVKAWQNFLKAINKKDAIIAGGALEGGFLDASAVEAVAKMPSKIELITRIGVGIRAVPTKIGKGIRLVPTKIGKGVKLAFDTESEKSD